MFSSAFIFHLHFFIVMFKTFHKETQSVHRPGTWKMESEVIQSYVEQTYIWAAHPIAEELPTSLFVRTEQSL